MFVLVWLLQVVINKAAELNKYPISCIENLFASLVGWEDIFEA